MQTVPVHLELADAGGLARVVSVLHARGLRVEHLHCDGRSLCVQVQGAPAARVRAVLDRVVEVTSVRVTRSCRDVPALPTRYLVLRQDLPATA